jgi:hypothetical protein
MKHEDLTLPPTRILADNSWRAKEFRTRTILVEADGKKVVRKLALTQEANIFLKAVAMREQANAKYLNDHFDVLCGQLKGDFIEYEYLPCESLEQKVRLELTKKRFDKANELLGLYVQKVHALKKLRASPRKLLSMVGQDTIENRTLEIDCLLPGLLDLTPRNILLDGDRWIVVDNEWSFDFPIPVVFLLFRAIREVVFEFQHEIRRCTKKTCPAVGILARGLRTYYCPADWIKYTADTHLTFTQMLRWEMGFQRYISGSKGGTVGHIKVNPTIKTHFSALYECINSVIIGVLSYLLREIP